VKNPLEKCRANYPILSRCTYLASHSLGAVPSATERALGEYYSAWAEQGIRAWEGPWWNAMMEFSSRIEAVLNAEAGTVVPMENVTRGMAAVASALDFRGPRNRVVMTDLEFTTSYPFWHGMEKYGAELVIVKSSDGITVPTEKIIAAVDERTLIVPTSQVYFRSGALQDLAAVTRAAHAQGAYVMGDGYQCVGTVPVDVRAMGVDFYVGGSHKWLSGGPGAGYLYVRKDLIQKFEPALSGWFGIANPFDYEVVTQPKLNEGIHRFLAGTVAIPALYAAREGAKLVQEAGLSTIREISQQMTSYIIDRADELKLEVRSPRDALRRSGMVCLQFDRSKEAADALIAQGIIVDWRQNCGIRVSPHFYNSYGDIDHFFTTLSKWRSR
jgi:kynureninase